MLSQLLLGGEHYSHLIEHYSVRMMNPIDWFLYVKPDLYFGTKPKILGHDQLSFIYVALFYLLASVKCLASALMGSVGS